MTTAVVPEIAAPFRGLAPFGETELDALLFFGRERETEIVAANLLSARLTILYGPSGVGKTSLLRAGVARRVRETVARGVQPDGIVVVFSAWADDPVAAIAQAVEAEARPLAGADAIPPPARASLADIVDHWATAIGGDVFLVLDQLEEHFLYHRHESGPGTLVDELPEVIVRPGLRVHVLLSLRDDALARLDVLAATVPRLFANVIRLDRLDAAAATAAILGPIQRYNDGAPPEHRVHVEPELVDEVLRQAGRVEEPGRIETPYLQLVLERVWAEEAANGSFVLRATTLERLGGAGEIVREHLDRALSRLGGEDQETAARMFEHLVTPSGTKIAHPASDLAELAHTAPERAELLLERLARERIVRPLDERAGASARFEIFHDVLAAPIVGWRRDYSVLRERRAAHRRQRRLAAVAAASLVALLVMAAVAVFALAQRHTAQRQQRSADARALAATALTQLDRDPELSLVLARRAAGLSGSSLVEDVLRQSLVHARERAVVRLGAAGSATAFTAKGRAVVGLDAGGRVVVANPRTGRVERSFATGARRSLVDASGDRVVAFGLHHPPRLLDVASGVETTLRSHPATGAAFSGDGRRVATTDAGRLIHVWDTAGGILLATLHARRPPAAVALSADGSVLAAAGKGGKTLEVFATAPAAAVRELRLPAAPTRLAFAPSGTLLAIAGADDTLMLRDARRGSGPPPLKGHVLPITSIAFDPSGALVATASTDGIGRVWDVSGRPVSTLAGHALGLTSISFAPDGARIVTASSDGSARVWDAVSGKELVLLAGHRDTVTGAVFSRDGRAIATTGLDGTMRLWDASTDPALTLVRTEPWAVSAARYVGGRIVGAPAGSPDLAVSGDGNRTASASGRNVVVRTAAGARVASFAAKRPATGIALSPGGDRVAVAAADGRLRIYGLDGSVLQTLAAGTPLTRISFAPDGASVAAGGADHLARIWDLATGSERILKGHTDTVSSARFSPDGTDLVTASRDHYARTWDVASGTALHVLRAAFGSVADAGFSADGRWVVTAGPSKAGVFDARSGDLLMYLQGSTGTLTSASFDPSGPRIVTSSVDGAIRSYSCDVCVGLRGLERLADAHLAATRRSLTAAERRTYLP